MKRPLSLLGLLALSLLVCGCATLIPGYKRPPLVAAPTWDDLPGYETPAGEEAAAQLKWQEFFRNSQLRELIGQALENNRDLRMAVLNIDEARALYQIQRADLLPKIDATGKASIDQTSDEESDSGDGSKTESYKSYLGASDFELDLFGRLRSLRRAALNEYKATQAEREAVQIALVAETAQTYLQYCADEAQLTLAQKTLEAQQRAYDILATIREKGIATQQDLARAQTTVERAHVDVHHYTRLIAQDKNALFVLIGSPHRAGAIPEMAWEDVDLPEDLPVGLPSEVLLGRPDIRQAEFELLARNANIGAARAAFFPKITLTGSFGFASQDLGKLFATGAAGAWSFAPQVVAPIFEGGRNKANLNLAETRQRQSVLHYEQTVESAFREISDSLVARATLSQELEAQQRLVDASQRVFDASKARYEAGLDSYFSVLDAQRSLYAAQQDEIEIQRQRLTNLVTLYKALGGGTAKNP